MNSVDSVDSESDSIPCLTDSANEMIPILDGISETMASLTTKLVPNWLHTPVISTVSEITRLRDHYGLPEEFTIHSLISAVFDGAKTLETETRTIHFKEDVAEILKMPNTNLFDFLGFLVSSVQVA